MRPVAVLALILATVYCETFEAIPQGSLAWWKKGPIYEIYIRSWKDSNGDGVGDLNGITEKLDYITYLGVKGVWISPFFKSPMVDGGYDIADFKAIDPLFGTMDDFKKLSEALKKEGLKLIIDFVPNHTSDEHDWFQRSINNEEPYADYYIWADAKMIDGKRAPPTNWVSDFGSGTAWTWNEQRKQYYYHSFHPKQPDLNFRNPKVIEEMKDVLTFWMDNGVDGFRMDAVYMLVEDDKLRSEPCCAAKKADQEKVVKMYEKELDHVYTRHQPETFEVLRQFRKHIDEYAKKTGTVKLLAAETYAEDIKDVVAYYGSDDEPMAHLALNYMFADKISQESNAEQIKKMIVKWQRALPRGKWSNWVFADHDWKRVATRYGIDTLDSMTMLQMVLPGTAFTYMGDDMGIQDNFIKRDQMVDTAYKFSRDPARTPFHWDSSVSAGFSTNRKTWLPISPAYWAHNVETETNKPNSHLKIYRRLVALKELPVIQFGDLKLFTLNKSTLVVTRSLEGHPTYVAVMNLGSETEYTTNLSTIAGLPQQLKLDIPSLNYDAHMPGAELPTDSIELRPKAAVLLTT